MKNIKSISEMIRNCNDDKFEAIRIYEEAIEHAREVNDQGTVNLLIKLIKMEEDRIDWTEKQYAIIKKIGMKNFLINQSESMLN